MLVICACLMLSQTIMPEKIIFIGDSVASVNPKYGQGTTVAILEALQLGSCLEKWRQENRTHLNGLPQVKDWTIGMICLAQLPDVHAKIRR